VPRATTDGGAARTATARFASVPFCQGRERNRGEMLPRPCRPPRSGAWATVAVAGVKKEIKHSGAPALGLDVRFRLSFARFHPASF
jgi:hypothetical protein